jgi:hypothetical protein
MNTAGSSLIAVARPTSSPRGHRVRGLAQSSRQAAASSMSICPNSISCRSGSSSAQAPSASAKMAGAPRPALARSGRKPYLTAMASGPYTTGIQASFAASRGSSATGMAAMAATGG